METNAIHLFYLHRRLFMSGRETFIGSQILCKRGNSKQF